MTIKTNSGLKLYMESARAAAVVLTGITNADPGVFTKTSHGLVTGDVIYLDTNVSELNGRAFYVTVIDADTFKLDDIDGTTFIDTTNFDVFENASAYKITLGTTITGVAEFSSSGGDPIFLDTSTVNDKKRKQVVNGSNPIAYNMTMQWDSQDSAQTAMIQASEAGAEKVFKVKWPDGDFMLFAGTVSYSGVPGGPTQGITISQAAVAMSGNPTYGTE